MVFDIVFYPNLIKISNFPHSFYVVPKLAQTELQRIIHEVWTPLMPSSYPKLSTLFHSPSPPPSPFSRTQYGGKPLFLAALSSSAANSTTAHQKPSKDYILQSKFEDPNLGFDDTASRLQVQNFIDGIKALPLKKRGEILGVLEKDGCFQTASEFNSLLMALVIAEEPDIALSLFDEISSAFLPDKVLERAVMDGFGKVGRSDEAMELLDEAMEIGLIPDVVSFNALFHGYCKEWRPMEGLNVLKKMKEMNCIPDCITYSSLLHGLLKWRKIRNAIRVYEQMVENGFEVEERLMNNLVRWLCRRSWREKDLLEDAHQLFERMRSGHSGVDASTYGLMIQSLCMGKKVDEALVSLQGMVPTGFSLWIVTFNNVIQGPCVERKGFRGIITPLSSRVSYNPLIHELNRRGSFLRDCTVYGAALKRGVIPKKNKNLLMLISFFK